MVTMFLSLGFLLLFAELSSSNFKRLSPVLEAWNQTKKQPTVTASGAHPFPWTGGWEKLATIVWAVGVSIPLLAFALACHLFLSDRVEAGNLVLGTTVGTNIIGLSLAFGLVLLSGPLTFFRIRTISSPVVLLLATVVFAFVCLNQTISWGEGFLLLLLMAAYGFYFGRFSSEWKQYERAFAGQSLIESAEGVLPVLAVLCMGIGFFLLAVLVSYPFVRGLETEAWIAQKDAFRVGAHFVSLALAVPWVMRSLFSLGKGGTARAIAMTNISHACLLNVLFLPAMAAFLGLQNLSPLLLMVHLPALLLLTGVFVAALLIEKEKGGLLPWFLIASYLIYTGLGLAV